MATYSNSIFFIDTDKIDPNPYQPRKDFEDGPLRDLADSIRMYGVLQPLTVSRFEVERADGLGMETRYELIAGERRLRASKLAGIKQVPVIIRDGDDDKMKLELAIIENLQREDLNPVDRARAFMRLIDEFKFTHAEVGRKMGKSREYVSNSLRILQMNQEVLDALQAGQISEGHTRPLMMLSTRPEEQNTLFKEIVYKKLSVREAERIARRIAVDRVRKRELLPDANVMSIEDELEEHLGTRVHIQRKADGGKITIDFFSDADLEEILLLLKSKEAAREETMLARFERERSVPQAPENLVTESTIIVPENIQMPIMAVLPEEMQSGDLTPVEIAIDNELALNDIPVENMYVSEPAITREQAAAEIIETIETIENPIIASAEEPMVIQNPKPEDSDQDLYNISSFSI